MGGLEGGISKDPNKVYKYASRRPKSRVDSNKTNKSTEQSEQPTPIQPHKAQPVGNMMPQPFQQPLLLSNPVQSPQQPPQRNRPLIAPSAMRQIAPVQSQSHLLATPAHSAQSLVSPEMQQRQHPQEVQIANKLSMRPVLQLHQPQQQQQPIQHTLVQTPSLHYRVPMPVTTPTAAYPFDFPSSATTEISSYSPSPACPVDVKKNEFVQAAMDMLLEGEIDAIANVSIAEDSDDEWFFVPDDQPPPPLPSPPIRKCRVMISREDERACRIYSSRVKLHSICSECPSEVQAMFNVARARLTHSSSTAHSD